MRLISLNIQKGFFKNTFDFKTKVTIIHSKKNSVGKTTLLRFILYSLGYNIPNMRGINFSEYDLELTICANDGKNLVISRRNDLITLENGESCDHFSLPVDINALHKIIFDIENSEILNNLLGAYYIDQEKGWTGLNRYNCIGKIHFSIEELIRGLANQSIDGLGEELTIKKREIQKYKYMLNIAEYKKEISELGENIAYDTPAEEIENKLAVLYSERKPVFDELKRLESVVRKNTSFKKHITNCKISVKVPDSEKIIPVNEDTIVALRETEDLISARRKMVADSLSEIDRKIKVLEQQRNSESTMFTVKSSLEEFDQSILKMKIDAIATQRIISRLTSDKKSLEKQITASVKQNTELISALHETISTYAKELGVGEKYVRPNNDYIFTTDLKSLSGAIFHKIVFAFRLGYIKTIFNYTGTRLPIILDSPSGGEIEKENVNAMIKILVRDFSEYQIIIASIYDYDFPEKSIIEINDNLLHFGKNKN
ncbi:MAG: hypothetical protein LBM19_01300 [Holosporales bacterium]|jgi:hypothetical protein|nr:hypothetical protein [Holosporales bacterium]